jgi:DNA-binding response OmpR family regulator
VTFAVQVTAIRDGGADRNARRATLAGRVLDLSAKEFALLSALARTPPAAEDVIEGLEDRLDPLADPAIERLRALAAPT